MTNVFEEEVQYSQYLLSHDKNSLNPDSIQRDADCINVCSSTLMYNAFKMFKISEIYISYILLSICDACSSIERYENVLVNNYNNCKQEKRWEELRLIMAGKPVTVPMYNFHTNEYSHNMLIMRKTVEDILKKVIAKMENGTLQSNASIYKNLLIIFVNDFAN
jgi:hypothetical protein